MKDLIDRSYKAIRKRGLITTSTTNQDFVDKMEEELCEIQAYTHDHRNEHLFYAEVVDLMNVCINALHHNNYDVIAEFKKCVIHQETRED